MVGTKTCPPYSTFCNRAILRGAAMSLSIQLPDNLEQQLTIYCQQHHLSKNETIRLALERLLTTANKRLTPYELGKDGFGSDQTHEGDIAQHTKDLLKLLMCL
jgi:RHH-type rel operon transcriptional repressor/antitoxin RelB